MKIQIFALALAVAFGLAIPASAQQTALCNDGTDWSGNARSGACARHGGVKEWTTPAAAPAPAAVPPSTVSPSATKMEAGQFSTEGDAKAHCPNQNIVWFNKPSKIYHYAGSRDYGHTKNGAFMCQADADKIGRAAKNEKAPAAR